MWTPQYKTSMRKKSVKKSENNFVITVYTEVTKIVQCKQTSVLHVIYFQIIFKNINFDSVLPSFGLQLHHIHIQFDADSIMVFMIHDYGSIVITLPLAMLSWHTNYNRCLHFYLARSF